MYRLAYQYVDVVDNDNDCDFDTNGELRFARSRLPGAKVAFDIGAAIGEWTEIALAANPQLEIHCFEPTTRRMDALRRRSFSTNVVLNQVGLGDVPATTQIFYDAGGSNSIFPQRYDGAEPFRPDQVEMIHITTIDNYCRERGIEHIDFVKMDIEGYEMAALRGAGRMLREGRIATVQFEYGAPFLDAGTSLLQLMKYVHATNPAYVFHKIYPDRIEAVHAYKHEFDNFKMQNWALIKS